MIASHHNLNVKSFSNINTFWYLLSELGTQIRNIIADLVHDGTVFSLFGNASRLCASGDRA